MSFEEQSQSLERLVLKFDPAASLPQFSCPEINFKHPKSKDLGGRMIFLSARHAGDYSTYGLTPIHSAARHHGP